MNRRTVLTKTGKGLMEATGKSSNLSRDLRNILKEIDGEVSVSELLEKFEKIPQRELGEALRNLVRDGYVREFIGQQDGGPRAATGRPPAPQASEGAGGDLDFTDFTPLKPSPTTSEDERLQAQAREIARQAQAMRTREEAAAKTKAKTQASTQAEALDRARREAEGRQRRQAEEKARREAEARARIDAAQAAKREAEERAPRGGGEKALRGQAEELARSEVEQRVRREAEERVRREEAERVARIEVETRAKVEAEMRARREFEERARREEEERSGREAELKRLAEEEARKRRDAEESEALMRSLREQEEKVQQEAEQSEREERERREREEGERREGEERARRESEEEARRKEEGKRDEEREKRTREEEKTLADSEAEEAAQGRKVARAKERTGEYAARGRQGAVDAAAQSARRAWAKRKPGNFVRQLALLLLVLLVVSIAVVPFVPLEPGPYEKAAQAWLGEPVKIGAFTLALLPMPRLKFEKVVIGKEPQIRVATIRAIPQIGSVLAEKKTFKRLELENVAFPRQYLSALLLGKGRGKRESLGVERLTAKGLKLDIPGLNLPALELDASFSPDGALKSVTFVDAERKLSVKLQPRGGKAAVEISSDKFPLPGGADLALEEFTAKGTVTRSELALNEAEARAFGGRLLGSARLRWSGGWSLEGEIAARQMDAAKIAAPLVAGGTLQGRGVYSMKAPLPERLLTNARLEGNFTVQKGSIANVDMTRLLQGGGPGGGTTPFSEMSGGVSAGPSRVLVRQIRMVAGLLSAARQGEMDPRKNLSGRLQLELRSRTVQVRATLAVAGTLKNPQFRRIN